MLIPIERNVTIQVVAQRGQFTRKLALQTMHQMSEHLGDQILPPVGEGGSDLMHAPPVNDRKGMPNKSLHGAGTWAWSKATSTECPCSRCCMK